MAHYQIDYKVHLPVDPPYRKEARNSHRITTAKSPEETWVAVVRDMTDVLGYAGQPAMLVGLLLEMLNRLPPDVRMAIASGIIQGNGLTLTVENGQLSGEIHPKYTSLIPEAAPTIRESGLIVPDEPKIILPSEV